MSAFLVGKHGSENAMCIKQKRFKSLSLGLSLLDWLSECLSVCLSHTLLPTHTQFAARVFLGNIENVLFFHYRS